jgi:hypothetical protein
VVWKTVPGKAKSRPVMDLRPINKWAIPDAYPMPLQSEVIEAVRGMKYITVIDASAFFYQFLVHPSDREKFTIVSHRGQEQLSVIPMGFKNSPAHVQRFMDEKLRRYKTFARAFIDDMVVFSRTAQEHLTHLRQILTLFKQIGLSLSPKKSFMAYPSVQLLGHMVDGLGMSTTKERVAAMANLQFPSTLRDLETYLGMTGFLRQFVPYYAKVVEPLQNRKTELLAKGRVLGAIGAKRKGFVRKTSWEPTEAERASFEASKGYLSDPKFLVHFDPDRVLFLKIDGSLERGFGAMIFHTKEGYVVPRDKSKIAQTAVQPIMFLSKLLSPAEKNYHPTELEVACLVYTCRKLRVMIQSSKHPVQVLTDHTATRGVCNQTSLVTTDASRSNMRLHHASQYLSQYNLDVHHIPGKLNIVPDALSRLTAVETKDIADDNTLDNIWMASEAILSEEYRVKFTTGYSQDPHWRRILRLLECDGVLDLVSNKLSLDSKKKLGVPFMVRDGLLYHVSAYGAEKLCILDTILKDVLEEAHTSQHFGVERMRQELAGFCIPRLTKKLRDFVKFCPSCLVNNTLRHRPHGELHPIRTPPRPFHTIAMDFILSLPEIPAVAPWKIEGHDIFDSMMTVTDKFSKKTLLIPGHTTYTAENWAEILFRMLLLADWGIPSAIISDRDRKFVSEFWRNLFKLSGTKLLMSTAWHPQTDGASEIKNQMVEIAMRHQVFRNPDARWSDSIVALQAAFNNAFSATIGTSPNELVLGFKPNTSLTILAPPTVQELPEIVRKLRQVDAEISIDFATNAAKERYDTKHQSYNLHVGDKVYLRLNKKGYHLLGRPNMKISE